MKNHLQSLLESPILRVSLVVVGTIVLAIALEASVIPDTIQLGPFTMAPRFYREDTLATGEYIYISPEPEFVGGTRPLIARNEAVLFVASDEQLVVRYEGMIVGCALWRGIASIDGQEHLALLLLLPRDVVEQESYVVGTCQQPEGN